MTTMSAILLTSHMAFNVAGHSRNVTRWESFLPHIVMGPFTRCTFFCVRAFIRDRINVLFPDRGGPTTAITNGGGEVFV
eukprot:CAMPEP_0201495994 /NCGR_PEP_ID=MMETSP0151_2-20130828/57312_1 /ASSEMBLY_ACC=CAM_ASM_000257 /TAXON_ID=200890 /ORGANISM="Paramoeba atlantica, Strain 621/1 / CCAP 1560/9" /LENGTH=78 /DNA_ID=CAMNT_0047885473 /DNA_START=262 /DNA_END=498 /DNA_ORIENTATION=-